MPGTRSSTSSSSSSAPRSPAGEAADRATGEGAASAGSAQPQTQQGRRGWRAQLWRCVLLAAAAVAAHAALTAAARAVVTVHSCTPYAPQGQAAAFGDIAAALLGSARAEASRVCERDYAAADGDDDEAAIALRRRHDCAPERLGWGPVLRELHAGVMQAVNAELGFGAPYYDPTPLVGKRILVVGGSYIDYFFTHAAMLGAQVILIDDPSVAEKAVQRLRVAHFVGVPEFQRISIQEPDAVVSQLREWSRLKRVEFDGVLTLVEDEAPLAARLAKAFELPGHAPEAADLTRSKTAVRNVMREAGLPTPAAISVDNQTHFESLEETFRGMDYPVFLKPVWGVAAAFATRADSYDDLRGHYAAAQDSIDPGAHSIFHYGSEMVVEEMLSGLELQLELMLLDGELVFRCFSSEYAEDRSFLVFPTRLTGQQQEAALDLAYSTVRALGLTTGIVHIEMFWSPKGTASNGAPGTPHIIEVNNRLSRGFLPQSFWHQLMFGMAHTDYFGSAIFLSLGLRPPTFARESAPVSLAVFLDNPSPNGWETYGECALFFDSTPVNAVQKGIDFFAGGK